RPQRPGARRQERAKLDTRRACRQWPSVVIPGVAGARCQTCRPPTRRILLSLPVRTRHRPRWITRDRHELACAGHFFARCNGFGRQPSLLTVSWYCIEADWPVYLSVTVTVTGYGWSEYSVGMPQNCPVELTVTPPGRPVADHV